MRNLFCLFIILFTITSCVKDKKTRWDTNIMVPIIKSNLTVTNLLKSENIIPSTDSSLKLVYSDELFSMSTDSFVKLPDSTFEVGSSLKSLELPNEKISDTITLGEIMRSSGDPILMFLYNYHGRASPFSRDETFPVPSQSFNISNNNLFDEVIVREGSAEVKISNELDFDMSNVEFKLGNSPQPGGEILFSNYFPSIPKKTSVSESVSLNGKTILSDLVGEILTLNVHVKLVAGRTIIDTSQYILAEVLVKDIKPEAATAIWPDQNIIDEEKIVPFGGDNNIDLKDASIREGSIYFEVYSSLKDSIYITYEVSNVTNPQTGLPFIMDTIIPPAKQGEMSKLTNTYSINGFHFDFNGKGYETPGDNPSALADDTINSYVTHLKARIQYTGLKKTLSLDDTVYVKAQIRNLKPFFARGYLNNQMLNVGPTKLDFNLFNKIKSGKIDINDVNFEIEIDNGIGASAEGRFNKISGYNNNKKVDLTFTSGGDIMQISSASYNGENTRTLHSLSKKNLTPLNSNIDEFIENLPNTLEYDLEVELNYGESKPGINKILNPDNPPNFIHFEDEIKASFNMEFPISIIADSLVLVDTLAFDLINKTSENIESGNFKLLVDNGFPLDASTSLYFLDDTDLIIDSLWTNKTINRSEINKSGKVYSKTRTVINFEISKEKMDNLKMASKVYIIANFHTFDLSDPEKKYYKIYSNYSFDVKLVGNFSRQFLN